MIIYNCGYSGSGGNLQSAPGEYIISGFTTPGAGIWAQLAGTARWSYVSQNDTWYGPGAPPYSTMINTHTGAGSAGQECGNSGYSGGIYLNAQ